MTHMDAILAAYTSAAATLEETNEALRAAGTGLRLDPQRCRLEPDEQAVLDEHGLA